MKFHLGALPAPALAAVAYALSPDFLNVLPEKYAKVGYGLATLAALFAPSLLKKAPTQ